jgi:hypothetical protein
MNSPLVPWVSCVPWVPEASLPPEFTSLGRLAANSPSTHVGGYIFVGWDNRPRLFGPPTHVGGYKDGPPSHLAGYFLAFNRPSCQGISPYFFPAMRSSVTP